MFCSKCVAASTPPCKRSPKNAFADGCADFHIQAVQRHACNYHKEELDPKHARPAPEPPAPEPPASEPPASEPPALNPEAWATPSPRPSRPPPCQLEGLQAFVQQGGRPSCRPEQWRPGVGLKRGPDAYARDA